MGLPRSTLVKKNAVPPSTDVLASPFEAPASDIEVAPTIPAMSPYAADVEITALDDATDEARPPMLSIPPPSREELVERAAALGPVRMTWESFAPTSDPILQEKQEPRIAERRARFTKIVKGTLAVCGGVCVVALLVTLVSGGPASASAATSAAGAVKTVPAQAVVSVEPRVFVARSKASPRAAAAITTAAFVRAKRR